MRYYDNKLDSEVYPSHLGWTNEDGATSSLDSLTEWLEDEYEQQDISISKSVKSAYSTRQEKKLWLLKTVDGEKVEVVVNDEYRSRLP
jgi:hypothetical protein